MIASVNRFFKAFSLRVIAAASVLTFTNHAHAQKPIIYPDGHFPPGNYYTAADLAKLSGQAFLASRPSYLTGTYEYLGVIKGEPTFHLFRRYLGHFREKTRLLRLRRRFASIFLATRRETLRLEKRSCRMRAAL
jgi:hypothetical protein